MGDRRDKKGTSFLWVGWPFRVSTTITCIIFLVMLFRTTPTSFFSLPLPTVTPTTNVAMTSKDSALVVPTIHPLDCAHFIASEAAASQSWQTDYPFVMVHTKTPVPFEMSVYTADDDIYASTKDMSLCLTIEFGRRLLQASSGSCG